MCTFDRHPRHSMCADADLPGYSNERIYFCLPLKLLLSLVGFQFSFRKIMSVSVQCVPFGDMVSFLLFVKLFVWSNFGWHHLYGVVKHCDLIKHTVNIASLAVNALFFAFQMTFDELMQLKPKTFENEKNMRNAMGEQKSAAQFHRQNNWCTVSYLILTRFSEMHYDLAKTFHDWENKVIWARNIFWRSAEEDGCFENNDTYAHLTD